MAFWIRYEDAHNGLVEVELTPGPTDISYPDAENYKVMPTPEGSIVIQRPLRDGRPRKWIWNGFGKNHAGFAELWPMLQSQSYRGRLNAGFRDGTIEIWEDVTGSGGFDALNVDGSKRYVRVKLLNVDRKPSSPGPVIYDASVTFYIQDDSYQSF